MIVQRQTNVSAHDVFARAAEALFCYRGVTAKAMEFVLREQLLCIRGNCDCEVDQMVLQFPIMADYAALWLNGHMVWATHGHVYNMDNHPPFQKGDILLHGHTHIPAAQQFEDGYYYINPGSVSIPKAGSRNSYLVLEGSTFTLKAIEDGSVISSFTVE